MHNARQFDYLIQRNNFVFSMEVNCYLYTFKPIVIFPEYYSISAYFAYDGRQNV